MWQRFPVVALGVSLDVVGKGLAVLFLEFRPDFQHVHLPAGGHDSDVYHLAHACQSNPLKDFVHLQVPFKIHTFKIIGIRNIAIV